MSTRRRPYHFLVSTTSHARSLQHALGAATYSYGFVYEALLPALRALGRVTHVDRPESRVSLLARQAHRAGEIPLHLAINPLQDTYLAPDVPNVVFPFWEFPDVPNRTFGHDTRQDWSRIANGADLILAACRFTADALRRACPNVAVAQVPVPLPAWVGRVGDWNGTPTAICCKHVVLDEHFLSPDSPTAQPYRAARPQSGLRTSMRAGFQKIAPLLGQKWMERIARVRQASRGRTPLQAAAILTRGAYKKITHAWLSDQAIAALSRRGRNLAARVGLSTTAIDPEIPASELTLDNLVYTSFLSMGDPRKNPCDLLTAYLLACRDWADATLVIKLAVNRSNATHELARLRALYRSLGIAHRCRVVVIADYLDDNQLVDLFRSTCFYVNTSHAEGACLPLMQALAAGRPAIAPRHTAMSDYIDERVAFVVESDAEPCPWPHDPEQRLETEWQRLRWATLFDGFLASQATFDNKPAYSALATSARSRMQSLASTEAAQSALACALEQLDLRLVAA